MGKEEGSLSAMRRRRRWKGLTCRYVHKEEAFLGFSGDMQHKRNS